MYASFCGFLYYGIVVRRYVITAGTTMGYIVRIVDLHGVALRWLKTCNIYNVLQAGGIPWVTLLELIPSSSIIMNDSP